MMLCFWNMYDEMVGDEVIFWVYVYVDFLFGFGLGVFWFCEYVLRVWYYGMYGIK